MIYMIVILTMIILMLVGIKFGIFIEKSLWISNIATRECIKHKTGVYKVVKVNYNDVREISKNLISMGNGVFVDTMVVLNEDGLSEIGVESFNSPHNPLEFKSDLFRQEVINNREFQEAAVVMVALKNGKCFMFRNRHGNPGYII